jgi:hypothetical protein
VFCDGFCAPRVISFQPRQHTDRGGEEAGGLRRGWGWGIVMRLCASCQNVCSNDSTHLREIEVDLLPIFRGTLCVWMEENAGIGAGSGDPPVPTNPFVEIARRLKPLGYEYEASLRRLGFGG